jgi:hypothetical protein
MRPFLPFLGLLWLVLLSKNTAHDSKRHCPGDHGLRVESRDTANGKPHLRIFLNQEAEDLKKQTDFIAPQLILRRTEKFRGFDWPQRAGGNSGMAAVRLNIDATGKITGMKLEQEEPKGMDFGGQLMMNVKDAIFLPGYRNGQPVACSFTLPFIYRGIRGGSQWKL